MDLNNLKKQIYRNEDLYLPNVFFIYWYLPTRYGEDEYSKKLLQVKQKNPQAIAEFSELLYSLLNKKCAYIICIIPSSNINNKNSGIYQIAKKLLEKNEIWEDGTEIIKRIKSLPPKHLEQYPYPTYTEEKETLEITDSERIKGRHLLLLDDITTKGQAIKVTANKLKDAGVRKITIITLGKTKFKKGM